MYNKYLITGISGMLFNDLKHLISDKEFFLISPE
jgi:hypothetical protein